MVDRHLEPVVWLLTDQHRRVRDLLHAVCHQARPGVRPGGGGAYRRPARYLAAHEAAEQVWVHPLALGPEGEHTEVVSHRLAEEDHLADLMSALEAGRNDRPCGAGPDLLTVMAARLLEHLQSEEEWEFPLLAETDAPQLDLLAARLRNVRPVARGWAGSARYTDLLEAAHDAALAEPVP